MHTGDPGDSQDNYHYVYYENGLDAAHNADGLPSGPYQIDDEAYYHMAAPAPWWARIWFAGRGIVHLAAFAVPVAIILALFGAVVMGSRADGDSGTPAIDTSTITPESAPTDTFVPGDWPADVYFAPHTVPALIRDEIAAVGAQMGYRFEGTAGQGWALGVEVIEGFFTPQVTIYGPSGAALITAQGGANFTLPEDGAYRVLVEATPVPQGTVGGVGVYKLSLFEA